MSLLALSCVIIAACETVPVEETPVTMEEAGFVSVMDRARANPSPPSADKALSQLLARTDLTNTQRAEASFLRAEKRRTGNFNLPGAVSDYDTFLAARPLDPKAADAKRYVGTARTRIRAAERRLAYLQTLRAWFDDSVLMGRLPEAAARYERSGLTPTEAQVYTLREAGYICATGTGKRVHNYGAMPSYVQNLTWCPSKPVTSKPVTSKPVT
ncbi:MAG: hypothetical protein AAFR74_09100 [Pseudomonadota bacterium]